jgi:hypothetical protein
MPTYTSGVPARPCHDPVHVGPSNHNRPSLTEWTPRAPLPRRRGRRTRLALMASTAIATILALTPVVLPPAPAWRVHPKGGVVKYIT